MRIYSSCYEAASETKREVAEMGKTVKVQTMQDKTVKNDPRFTTKELLCYAFMILNTKDKDQMLKAFGKEKGKKWAQEEFKERVSTKKINPGNAWKSRKDVWKEFLHEGKFSYTYNERLHESLPKVIRELKKNSSTRQAVLPIFWDSDLDKLGGKARVPCSLFYQFIIREGKLHIVYMIRSNDVGTHFAYDIWLAITLQEYVAKKVGVKKGSFYYFGVSLHSYADYLKGIF